MRLRTKKYYEILALAMVSQDNFNIHQWMKNNRIKEKYFSKVFEDYLYTWALLVNIVPEEELHGKAIFEFTE